MPINQQNRMVAIETALGRNVLGLRSMSFQEQLGRLFQIEVELSSEDAAIDFDKVVGRGATIRLDIGQRETRFFHGVFSRLVQSANRGGLAQYHGTMVPWLWFLTRTSDCRIFQDKTAPEIIEEVFKGHGFSDYKLSLSEPYSKREYCVQYRETDFNFVSRLMEEEGIYYFFQHEADKHTLILVDAISAHKPFDGYEEVVFHELEKGAPGREVITDWVMEKAAQPVAYAMKDFDFTKPKAGLDSNATVTRQHGKAVFEMYDYPGEYVEQDQGNRLAEARLAELQCQYEVLRGQGSARGLAAGCTFKLKKHPREDQNREYLITGVTLQVDAGEFASTPAGQGAGEFFACSFTALDKSRPFRAARVTPKPVVQGPQTAIVVGPKGEEIHTDKYGRVKVQFHWDRYGKADENSSCWIRVSQVWAGKQWGGLYTPRISQEVIVEFLEGDPDRPIITGRVYNEDSKVPYELPASKTMSTLKSLSSKGGAGFNEIRFEDKAGEEQLFIHAQRNLDMRNGKDRFDTVSNDHHTKVSSNAHHSIGADSNLDIGANWKVSTGSDRNLTVGGKSAVQVGGSDSRAVGGAVIEQNGGNRSMSVGGNLLLTAANITIQASSNLTLIVGGTSVVLGAGGLLASSGGDVKVAGANVETNASGQAKLLGGVVDVNGGGPVTVKGAVVKVNS